MPASVRPAAVAGMFYPADSEQLEGQIQACLEHAKHATGPNQIQAIITPHAGLIYSGPTAAVAWSQAHKARPDVSRILLLGPSHRVGFTGIATSPAKAWRTPLGEINLDQERAQQLERELPFVQLYELAQEHSLEVQVPFIQTLYPGAKLLPLVVGNASAQQVAQVLNKFWQDQDTLIAISSDLSHFHDYQTAQQLDQATVDAICHYQVNRIGPEQACGCRAINGLLLLAQQGGHSIAPLELCNSGDTAGDKDRVVGYGAIAVL